MKTRNRRLFIKEMSLAFAMISTGCSSIAKIVMQYPEEFDSNLGIIEESLKAFSTTIIPGADINDPDLIRAFSDPYYPFLQIRGYFVYTLSRLSNKYFSKQKFFDLKENQRIQLVTKVLKSGGRKRQLFKAAIALVQISYYAGIYDARKGCLLIDYHGMNYGYRPEEMFYDDYYNHLAREETTNGNYI